MTDLPSGAGWSDAYAAFAAQRDPLPECVGRVVSEHRGGFTVLTSDGEHLAQAPASLRRKLTEIEEDKPAVGDWVGYERVPDGSLILRSVLPRRTRLRRKRPGSERAQVLVSNVDRVFVVTSVGRDFSVRRLERYLALILDGGAEPIVVVSKTDLTEERESLLAAVAAVTDARVVFVSAVTGEGIDTVRGLSAAGMTVAMLGSSGVGKSSLANVLLGNDTLAVSPVRDDGKGRHTTTRRELLCLPSGGVLIDTPGMRELALYDATAGVSEAFADVEQASSRCRFGDCRHENEPGCGIQAALLTGELSEERVASYRKLMTELAEQADPVATARERSQRGRVGARLLRARLRDKGRK